MIQTRSIDIKGEMKRLIPLYKKKVSAIKIMNIKIEDFVQKENKY